MVAEVAAKVSTLAGARVPGVKADRALICSSKITAQHAKRRRLMRESLHRPSHIEMLPCHGCLAICDFGAKECTTQIEICHNNPVLLSYTLFLHDCLDLICMKMTDYD